MQPPVPLAAQTQGRLNAEQCQAQRLPALHPQLPCQAAQHMHGNGTLKHRLGMPVAMFVSRSRGTVGRARAAANGSCLAPLPTVPASRRS
ncbi:hypothetical protein NDU88_000663 [Pleurodeles waltl]|uniref:Uncharacterized protein n=1 Tax=Pleurodeles waltl TaxID=8319 RepID=A0AAV7RAF2_PLEWA|nr:hypothetical protein NDU88_000663 [Pleurodeles waltl]